MHNAVGLKMLRANRQLGYHFIAGSVKEVQLHRGDPPTDSRIDLSGEIAGVR